MIKIISLITLTISLAIASDNKVMTMVYSEEQGYLEIVECDDNYICDERFLFCLEYIGEETDKIKELKKNDTKLIYCRTKDDV